ncbi:MAG TPA: alpha/beta fold hydrolase [Caldimonas sp.]|jgi:pimeloyl-ACP methyl ester carboxylesterase|nr:alpha/beta fold hydrolase [Caldimonas sp.]
MTRRRLLAAAAGSAVLAACTTPIGADELPPIVFVPGNGDTAALWMPTIWRFESNGWPRSRLFALDMPYPLARDDDTKEQPGRSSAAEHMAYLSAQVKQVLAATGAKKVALVGNSRGGYAIRNFVANGGGAALVSHVVLGGAPNHGVYADAARRPGNEFNGAGPFLSALNRGSGDGNEVTPGVAWLTIRSDRNDKYAQPDGALLGAPGMATHVTAEGPALKGADNVVIAGVDHRETAFSPEAFAATFRFIAGRPPATLAIVPEAKVVLDGVVSGLGLDNREGDFATNLPLAGATVEVYATSAATGERLGLALHRKTIGADGHWGPFVADGAAHYEFVVAAPGYATTHIYRSPFPRSSSYVSVHPERLAAADRDAASIVTLTRPRGYFGVGRDRMSLDGASPPPGVPAGVPSVSASQLRLADAASRPIAGEFNGERIVGRIWPRADNQVTVLELTY